VASFFWTTLYVYVLQYLSFILVSEKETLVKQHLLIIGMRQSAYWYVFVIVVVIIGGGANIIIASLYKLYYY